MTLKVSSKGEMIERKKEMKTLNKEEIEEEARERGKRKEERGGR